MRKLVLTALVLGVILAVSGTALAAEGTAFVCPVFTQEAVGMHNPNVSPIAGGDWSFGPGNSSGLSVPDQATNADGAGSPGGEHAEPGEPGYTAIWSGN